MSLPSTIQSRVEKAIRRVHPYEEPSIDWAVMRPKNEQPAGRIGAVTPISLADFARHVRLCLNTKVELWGDPAKTVRKVAVVGGAAGSDWRAARSAGADVFITGEIKQNDALEASESGMPMIAAGHYATEQPGVDALAKVMSEKVPEVEWNVYTPNPGIGGRPSVW
jgi:putative NIF3 family GTP cyclohydrolase 1 type 2